MLYFHRKKSNRQELSDSRLYWTIGTEGFTQDLLFQISLPVRSPLRPEISKTRNTVFCKSFEVFKCRFFSYEKNKCLDSTIKCHSWSDSNSLKGRAMIPVIVILNI